MSVINSGKPTPNAPQKSQIVVQFPNDNTDKLNISVNEPTQSETNNLFLEKSKSLESINKPSDLSSPKRSLTPTNRKSSTAQIQNSDKPVVVRRKKSSRPVKNTEKAVTKRSAPHSSPSYVTAYQKLESLFGSELAYKLRCDNTNLIRLNGKAKMESERNSIDSSLNSNNLNDNESDTSKTSSTHNSHLEPSQTVENEDTDRKKKQKLDEYYHIEEKQAKLLKILANVNKKLNEENGKQQQKLFDMDEFMKVFYVVVELEQLATLVHDQVSAQIKKRVEIEWADKPYFGDILTTYYHFYKVYKAILERYPVCQITLSSLLKKKNFALLLKKLLVILFYFKI